MNYSMYQQLAPLYGRVQRALNPLCLAPENREWMTAWWTRRDEIQARVDEMMATATTAADWQRCTAFIKANPTVPITEESVKVPVPPVVEATMKEDFTDPEF